MIVSPWTGHFRASFPSITQEVEGVNLMGANCEQHQPSTSAGLIGETPRLGDLVDGDLRWSIDFRRVYATLLDGWLGLPAESVLG
jgi:hypothetical protein